MKTFHYYSKTAYGIERLYPDDIILAYAHTQLTGRITMTNDNIEQYKKLGVKLEHDLLPPSEPKPWPTMESLQKDREERGEG